MCSYEDFLEGGVLGGDFLNSLIVSWVSMGILLVMFSGFYKFHKGSTWLNISYCAILRGRSAVGIQL